MAHAQLLLSVCHPARVCVPVCVCVQELACLFPAGLSRAHAWGCHVAAPRAPDGEWDQRGIPPKRDTLGHLTGKISRVPDALLGVTSVFCFCECSLC